VREEGLDLRADGTVGGSDVEKGRLAALLRKTLQWYAVATALTVASLLIGGTFFFAFTPTTVSGWQYPWIALAILAGGTLFLTPFLSMLEGCGLVADVARVRTWQAIASSLTAWTVLLAGGRLWASPAISGAALLIGGAWVFLIHRRFFSDLLCTRGEGISWREEVWPFQWRIAVSWMSSYVIFHLFIPVLFTSRGPAAAGRMGMSLALASAVCGTLVLHAIGHRWSERLLEPLPFALLLATMTASTIFFAEAVYLRAHKQEPLLGPFIASALAVGASTLFLGRAYGAAGMMLGYFATTLLVSLGGGTWVFLRKRREWHA